MSKTYKLKNPVWKQLGVSTDSKVNSAELVKLAKADFLVSKKPVYIHGNNKLEEVKGFSATYREDTGKPFAVVKSRYEVVQNHEVFDFFDNVVANSDEIKFETAGITDNGASLFMTVSLPDYIRIKNSDDVVKSYFVLTNSHDGSSAIRILFTPVRVVCWNTLQIALKRNHASVYFKHTTNVREKIEMASQAMGIYRDNFQAAQALYNKMAEVRMNEVETAKYIARIFLEESEYVAEQNKIVFTDQISVRKHNIVRDIDEYVYNGIGQNLNTTKGTLWGVYNGITGYFQNAKYDDTPADNLKQFNSNLFGANSGSMHKALALANDIITQGIDVLSFKS